MPEAKRRVKEKGLTEKQDPTIVKERADVAQIQFGFIESNSC